MGYEQFYSNFYGLYKQLKSIGFMWIVKHLPRFTCSFEKNILWTINKNVKDVVKLRGLEKNQPYVIIDNTKINLVHDTFIGNIKHPESSTKFLHFFDKHLNYYNNSTPVLRMLMESFFLQMNTDMYFVLTNEPIITPTKSKVFEDTEGSHYIQPVVTETLGELSTLEQIERSSFHNHLMKNVIDSSDQMKMDKIRYKQLQKIVQAKIQFIEQQIQNLKIQAQTKSFKRIRNFTTVIFAQIAILHYFIYFNMSWDIMEPIVLILANFDAMAAYYFFLMKGQNYSHENAYKVYFEKHTSKLLRQRGIDQSKYEQYLEIKTYLNMRLNLLTKNELILLQAMEKPLVMLDTR